MKKLRLTVIITSFLVICAAFIIQGRSLASTTNTAVPRAQSTSVQLTPVDTTERTATPSGLVTAEPEQKITPSALIVVTRRTDLSPDVPVNMKAAIVIQHADGSIEEFMMEPEVAETFLRQLAVTDKVLVLTPPASMMGHHPAQITPLPGSTTYTSEPEEQPTTNTVVPPTVAPPLDETPISTP